MKNLATIFTILFMAVTPSLAFDNATCVTETKELASNQAIKGAYADVQASLESDLKTNPLDFCNIINAECKVNIQAYSANLSSACEAEGGQLVEKDLTATCNGNLAGTPIPDDFQVLVFDAPLCAGASCDPSALPSEIETEMKSVLEDVVTEVNTAINGNLKCDVSINGDGTTSGVQATAIWTSAAGVALLSSIMM